MIPLRFCACATMQNDTLWLLVPRFCKISLLSLVNSSTWLRISFEKKTVPWIRARRPLNPDFSFLTYFWNEISSQFFFLIKNLIYQRDSKAGDLWKPRVRVPPLAWYILTGGWSILWHHTCVLHNYDNGKSQWSSHLYRKYSNNFTHTHILIQLFLTRKICAKISGFFRPNYI